MLSASVPRLSATLCPTSSVTALTTCVIREEIWVLMELE